MEVPSLVRHITQAYLMWRTGKVKPSRAPIGEYSSLSGQQRVNR